MSARVVMGITPAGKPHPATKWSLLIALLMVVVLGVPKIASAGQPSVQAPTGAQSGGVFTGTYTFATYIACSSGFSFNSSYSNNLEGTHTFSFSGSADGSLLVSIDGSGLQLVTSCGDPFTGPFVGAGSFSVTKDSTPPSPTPTPTPSATPAPTPTPNGSGGGGSAGSGGSSSSGGTSHTTTTSHTTIGAPIAATTPTPTPGATPTPTASATPLATAAPTTKPSAPTRPTTTAATHTTTHGWPLGLIALGFATLILAGAAVLVLRSAAAREAIASFCRQAWLRIEPRWFKLRQTTKRLFRGLAHDQPKRRGLSPHHHSGRLVAHHHTSYPALAFLVLLASVLTAAASYATHADSSDLSLTVPGPPPAIGATIDQPQDGDHFTVSSTTIRGTCPVGLLLEVYRNGTFAGSSLCDTSGLYAIIITLTDGTNDVVVKDSDALGQYGPDSAMVQLTYDAPPAPSPSPTPSPSPDASPTASPTPSATPVAGGTSSSGPSSGSSSSSSSHATTPAASQVLLLESSQHFYRGVEVDVAVTWNVNLAGGGAPYTITWNWGDGTADVTTSSATGNLQLSHSYAKAGVYDVVLHAQDTRGREAVLQLVTIVGGGTGAAITINGPTSATSDAGHLAIAWPTLAFTSLILASFWLGERHKLTLLRPAFAPPKPA